MYWDGCVLLQKPEGFPESPTVSQAQTLASQERFLDALARCGIKSEACKAADVGLSTIDYWGANDTWGFQKRKVEALDTFLGVCEAEINRRAIDGTEKPVYWHGKRIDTIREYSDNLLMFRTKRLDIQYRDNHVPETVAPGLAMQINITLHPDAVPDPRIIEGSVTDSGTGTDSESATDSGTG